MSIGWLTRCTESKKSLNTSQPRNLFPSYNPIGEDGKGTLTGDRYELSGKTLPAMKDWMVKQFDIDLSRTTTAQPQMQNIPAPTLNQPFVDAVARLVRILINPY